MKIGVIGAGAVGSACLLSIVMRGCAREIVVLDRTRKRAIAVATDMQYGATLSSAVDIRDGDYPDLAGAALVMITAGVNEKTGGATDRSDPAGRLKLLDQNVDVYRQILPQLLRVAPEAVVLVVTDPPDPLADLLRMFGFERVLSSGTFLGDTSLPAPLGSAAPRQCELCGRPDTGRTWDLSGLLVVVGLPGGSPPVRRPAANGSQPRGASTQHRARCPLRQYRHYRRKPSQSVRDRHCVGTHCGNGTARRARRDPNRFLQHGLWRHDFPAQHCWAQGGRADPRTADVWGGAASTCA